MIDGDRQLMLYADRGTAQRPRALECKAEVLWLQVRSCRLAWAVPIWKSLGITETPRLVKDRWWAAMAFLSEVASGPWIFVFLRSR